MHAGSNHKIIHELRIKKMQGYSVPWKKPRVILQEQLGRANKVCRAIDDAHNRFCDATSWTYTPRFRRSCCAIHRDRRCHSGSRCTLKPKQFLHHPPKNYCWRDEPYIIVHQASFSEPDTQRSPSLGRRLSRCSCLEAAALCSTSSPSKHI